MRDIISVLLLIAAVTASAQHPGQSRAKYNFNSGWLVQAADAKGAEAAAYPDRNWKAVTIPYAWNEDSAFKVSIEQLPTGIAWYRKHFTIPSDSAGKKMFLEFEGIRQSGEFYLNGESIGRSENGVMAFGFDITDKIKPAPAENVLAVRINNSWGGFQWNDRNFYANYGGINKNVWIHFTSKLYQTLPLYSNLGTTGVYIYARNFDIPNKTAEITAEAQVKNEYAESKKFSYEVTIRESSGKPVQTIQGGEFQIAPGETKTIKTSAPVSGLNFWSWGYGYLYDVSTELKVNGVPVDTVQTRTGFRKTEFVHGFMKLNNRAIQLKGYAQRTTNEWPAIGLSVPPWMSDFSNGLMVEGNANFVRWMHVTPWKQDVESLDRVGLMQAMPAGDSEKDVTDRRWEQRVEVMRDAIIYNRNNPSIVFYECGNKGISEEHMAEMKAVRDQYDPCGRRAVGAREMLGSKIAEYGGEMLYINKSAHIPMWQMEYSRDEGLRKYWDNWTPPYHKDGDGPMHQNKPAPEYNHNQDTFTIENVVRWYDYWSERPGTGDRVNAGGAKIIFSDSNTHHRGSENYRSSGEVDAMRIPKDGFFAHQVMWDGWVDAEQPRIHIVGHWNYEPNVRKPIYVVSNADKVELFINNQSRGFGERSTRFLYSWKEQQFQPGEIEAIGYDAKGKRLCETAIRTAGAPAALKLTPHTAPGGLKADGADMALVDIEVVDIQGNRCPTALNLITFDLQGPAEWRGGIAQGIDNYILSTELPVECGINRIILRSLPQPGRIILNASTAGLKPANIELASTPFPTECGLSRTMPDAGLSGRLDRGPTPSNSGIVPQRKAIRIVAASAGSNSEQAAKAYDDNETTAWKSDGQRASAWIQFELDHLSTVNEIVLKLGGWRSKAYPIRITVDSKEAFVGTTPKSLGYVTLPLKPMQGKTVRIELTGAIDEKDGFGLVEVTGKKLSDATKSGAQGTMEIVEAEIYEPMSSTR
ncbi:MAG: DUF4982 domain-containing protein [Chthoniobacteraceae bacterium]